MTDKVCGRFSQEEKQFLRASERASVGVKGSIRVMQGSCGHAHSFLNFISKLLSVAKKSCLPPEVNQCKCGPQEALRHKTMSLKWSPNGNVTQGDSCLLRDLIRVGCDSVSRNQKGAVKGD